GAISIYRQHGWLDYGGSGPAALADLWLDAHARRCVAARLGGQRAVHPDRIHGHVRSVGDPVSAAGIPGDRARSGGGVMETLWFMLVAVMIAIYVVLDGFDLGAGIVQLLVARTDRERRQVLASIGPVWDGNEVWLLAGGGTLYFAFPALYASGFSGFYLPLMIV